MRSALWLAALLCTGCATGPRTYLDRGDQHFSKRKFEDASIQYRRALQKDPNQWEAHYRLGLTLREQGQLRAAWVELRRAVELAPESEVARRDFSALTLAAYLSDGARSRAFRDDLEKQAGWFLSRPSTSFEGWRLKMYLAMGDRHPSDAAEFAAKADASKPMEPDVALLWVQALLQTGQGEQAEQVAGNFFSQRKNAPALYDVMYGYYAGAKRYGEAESMLAAKARIFPADAGIRIQLAAHYARTGQRDKESEALAEVLDHPAQFRGSRLAVADYRLRNGARDEAIRLLEAGTTNNDGDALPCFRRLTEIRLQRGDRIGALACAQEGMRRFPADIPLAREQAVLLLDSGTAEARKTALGSLTALAARVPQDASIRFLLGRALTTQGQIAEAGKQLRESFKLDASAIAPRIAAAELELYGGRTKEALSLIEQALSIAPGHLAARELRVTALRAEGHYPEARQELRSLQREFPGNPALAIESANLSLIEGKLSEAKTEFRKLYQPGQEDLRPLIGLVECHVRNKDQAGARRLLEADLVKAPDRPFVRMMLGDAMAATAKPDLAAQHYELALQAAPGSPAIYRRLGRLYASTGNSRKAIANLQKSLESNSASVPTLSLLAEQCDLAGQTDQAERYYRRWLELEPASGPAQNNLAYLLAEKGSLDEALGLAKKACQKTGQLAPVADTLGWIYLKKKMTPSALEIFRGLARRYPDVATFRYHLGLALMESGDRRQAFTELEAALTKRPNSLEQTRIQEALSGGAHSPVVAH